MKSTKSVTIATTIVLVAAILVLGATSTSSTIAQTNSTQMQSMNPKAMMSPGANITGSIPILPTMMQALKSRVHTNLNEATTSALKSAGGNSSAVAAFIHPENGFLVYDVIVLGANNNLHRMIVDAGNGKVLASQSTSMQDMMMGGGMEMMMGHPEGMMMGQHPGARAGMGSGY
jgi:uncharacterized membrane protein YkoI